MYETFLDTCHELSKKYEGNLERTKRAVSRRAKKLVAKAERVYHEIHPDFQQAPYTALQGLKDKISQGSPMTFLEEKDL